MPEPRYDARTITNLAEEHAQRHEARLPQPGSEIINVDCTPLEMRTVHGSDGTIGTLGCVPGSYDHLTDDEIVAMMRDVLANQPEDD